jgi:hypothetical protein
MGRRCTVCAHEARADIDAALLEGTSEDEIAGCTGLARTSLQRHAKNHLPQALIDAVAAQDAQEKAVRAETLLESLRRLWAKAEDLLAQAESAGEYRTALAGVREARATLEVIGRVTREIGPPVEVNVTAVDHSRLPTEKLRELDKIAEMACTPTLQ